MLLVLSFAPRGFSLGAPVFLSFVKKSPNHYLFIYLFIYLQLTKFTKMNVWVYYLYWSNKYPVGPDDPICRVATMKRNQTKIDEEEFPIVSDEISAEY